MTRGDDGDGPLPFVNCIAVRFRHSGDPARPSGVSPPLISIRLFLLAGLMAGAGRQLIKENRLVLTPCEWQVSKVGLPAR